MPSPTKARRNLPNPFRQPENRTAMHIHTHYDNLQLPQDASEAEIRQAYRRLSKRYHPDLNSDPDAHRIMQLVNRAYEVLSDPVSRAEHDRWIAAQHSRRFTIMVAPAAQHITYYTDDNRAADAAPAFDWKSKQMRVLLGLGAVALIMVLAMLWQLFGWLKRAYTAPPPAPPQIEIHVNTDAPRPAAAPANYSRPDAAPNGTPWPQDSGYVAGYPVITGMGNSTIVADNVRNSSDVFGQLYEKTSQHALRTFFLRERGQLELRDLDAGEYFIRYHQLDDGEHLDSESINIDRNRQQATIYLQRGKAPAVVH